MVVRADPNKKLMEWMLYIVAVLFLLLGAVCVVLVALQLPGGWIMLALAVLIEFCDGAYLPEERDQTFAWWVLGAVVGCLLLGELLEFIAGVLGAKRGGASRAGMVGSLIGGIVGALSLGGVMSIIPGVGTVLGVLLGALAGTFAGAVIGEIGVARQTMRGSMKPAIGASIGRIMGTASKLGLSIVVWLTLSFAAFWH